jgi:REP element-mobilizing transposase RayT
MTILFYRHLPHYHPPEATYFVTFRVAGSLPQEIIKALCQERECEERLLAQRWQGAALAQEMYRLHKKLFARYDACLDHGQGPRWLADSRVAQIVMSEIQRLHPQGYGLVACYIMSNHVHLLVDLAGIPEPPQPKPGQHYTVLSHALRLLKGRSARSCNQLLGRRGPFWADESYDHVVRDEKERERIIAYILDNPVKAGLVKDWQDWPFTYFAGQI